MASYGTKLNVEIKKGTSNKIVKALDKMSKKEANSTKKIVSENIYRISINHKFEYYVNHRFWQYMSIYIPMESGNLYGTRIGVPFPKVPLNKNVEIGTDGITFIGEKVYEYKKRIGKYNIKKSVKRTWISAEEYYPNDASNSIRIKYQQKASEIYEKQKEKEDSKINDAFNRLIPKTKMLYRDMERFDYSKRDILSQRVSKKYGKMTYQYADLVYNGLTSNNKLIKKFNSTWHNQAGPKWDYRARKDFVTPNVGAIEMIYHDLTECIIPEKLTEISSEIIDYSKLNKLLRSTHPLTTGY